MMHTVVGADITIQYDLQYKQVKHINLRVRPDGRVFVSAHRGVPQGTIDAFVLSKADWIRKVLERYQNQSSQPQKQYFDREEICGVITAACEKVYPHFAKRGISYPKIKFRNMVSRWGSCHPVKGVLTFNTALMYAPIECIEYVAAHEFTHFLQPNHSRQFYEELEKVCPDWKVRRQALKEISIRER